jgi:hypothetical protein
MSAVWTLGVPIALGINTRASVVLRFDALDVFSIQVFASLWALERYTNRRRSIIWRIQIIKPRLALFEHASFL